MGRSDGHLGRELPFGAGVEDDLPLRLVREILGIIDLRGEKCVTKILFDKADVLGAKFYLCPLRDS